MPSSVLLFFLVDLILVLVVLIKRFRERRHRLPDLGGQGLAQLRAVLFEKVAQAVWQDRIGGDCEEPDEIIPARGVPGCHYDIIH